MPRNIFKDLTSVEVGMSRMARTLFRSVTTPPALSKWPMNDTCDKRSLIF